MKPLVYRVRVRGCIRWRVDYVETGRRVRKTFRSEPAANAWAAQLASGQRTSKALWARLPEAERERIIFAWHDARKRGEDLHELLIRARQLPDTTGSRTLQEVIEELLDVKAKAGRHPRYLRVLGIVLGGFARGRESVRMDALLLADVERYLDAHRLAYRATLRGRISALFRFAVRRGYRVDNPCERLEAVRVTAPPPAILTVAQTQTCLQLLNADYPRALGWFVLTTFCGLRPEEATQTRWGDIDFAEGWIRVEAQTTKVRQRRVVYPRPEALKWLREARRLEAALPLPHAAHRKALAKLREALGWTAWPKDVTRHSAASYWLATEGSASKVAENLGHSERTLQSHYKALVTREEAREFWGLSPRQLSRT